MPQQSSYFEDVFNNLSLSTELKGFFSGAEIRNIKMNKRDKRLEMDLRLKRMVHETSIDMLSDELSAAFPFIDAVDINYFCEEDIAGGIAETIRRCWDNILHRIGRKSPFCVRLLAEAKLELDGGALNVQLNNKGSFLLRKRFYDREIEAILRDSYGVEVSVRILDESVSAEQREKYFRTQEEKFNAQAAMIPFAAQGVAGNEQGDSVSMIVAATKDTSSYAAKSSSFSGKRRSRASLKINPSLSGDPVGLSGRLSADDEIFVTGDIFELEVRELKSGKQLVTFDLTDGENSISAKVFMNPDNFTDEYKALLKKGVRVNLFGKIVLDDFTKELTLFPTEISRAESKATRQDKAEEKRVELHLHTQMSQMDAINSASEYIRRAKDWGHSAIAITDHGVVQAFPEAMEAGKKHGVKIIYGVEAYLVDDLSAVVQSPKGQLLSGDFVVFDIETTGLKKEKDHIIEIGAVKIRDFKVIERYSRFVHSPVKLPQKIIELTKITDDMLEGARDIADVLPEFLDFAGDSVLVAHNADFDVGFITVWGKKLGLTVKHTVIDTLTLARILLPELTRHKLNIVAEKLGISLENHHRAVDDANATAEVFLKFLDMLKERGAANADDINVVASEAGDKKRLKHYHAIILVKNQAGLRHLYELVSNSHLKNFFKRPRILKSEYARLKEGLIIGTACEAGEFYKAVKEKRPQEQLDVLADFYDFFEIQPLGNNQFMVREAEVSGVEELKEINRRIVELGEFYNKPVVATCDVHFLDPEEEVYRRIIQHSEGYKDADNQAPLYFRTTGEMLNEFAYLGEEKAYEVVVKNSNRIAELCEFVKPIPDETFPPKIEGAEEQIKEITMQQARKLYGENLPEIVAQRLDKELYSIIKNGFSVMYIIAQKLVWKSVEDGYLVGSRGSVGSSFVATMAGITEVNPLPPHYLCPNCCYSDFDSPEVKAYAGASGCDMPEKNCPNCGTLLNKDGHDIPFETFLGFDGDKEPDIDLNFSGEYQAKAHAYTEELFGEGNVFKAGTIGTVADKTAYMYVKKYFEEKQISARNAEINRLKNGCTGIKRTTGQHPGGLMILPNDHSIYEFCPIQRPANDVNSNVTTTHFDYHSISGRLLKLDLLGHDVPTIIRMLHDSTGIDPRTVDLGNKEAISLFTSPAALGVTAEEIRCKTGSLGLPEFGTSFVRQMLLDTDPHSFAELVRISGLSHGTDVWFNNAQELIKNRTATLKEVIPTRDDIMVYLINKGVEKKAAFKIMENVRKGKGLREDEVETMKAAGVPDWYIESCRRIKYMFPKGHAVAYVMMTVRIAYFKIFHPYSFYAATFSVKAEDFDYMLMCKGKEVVLQEMNRINSLDKEATAKEKNSLTLLELVLEMYARGLSFVPVSLYESDAAKFRVTDKGLLPPLCSIQGLGLNVANNIVEARADGEFLTQEDFKNRTKANKTVTELLRANDLFQGIPETSQLSLF